MLAEQGLRPASVVQRFSTGPSPKVTVREPSGRERDAVPCPGAWLPMAEAMQRLNATYGMRVDLELAGFFADHGDAVTALRLARRAYAERPTVFAADTLAWALYRAGRPRAALPYAHEALRLGTRSSRLRFHAGAIEAANGHENAARTHLAAALELNPAFSPLDAPRAAALLRELKP